MTKVYIVRHCEAYGNSARVFQGRTDCDITQTGQKQLDCLAERFKDIHIDKIYSSPLKRAYKTAQAINRYHSLDIIKEPGIIEIDGGEIEGISWVDFPKTKPVLEYNWNIEPHKFHPLGGESMASVYNRAHTALERIVSESSGLTIALASHGCTIRNIMCYEMGLPLEKINTVDWADNTGVFLLEFNGDKLPQVKLFNDCSHLTADCLPNAHRIGRASIAKEKVKI